MQHRSGLRLSVLDQSPIPDGASPAQALENTLRLARHAERLGYHRYWVAEHHGGDHFAASAPEIVLARLGAEVRQMRIGSGAILLPHYSAIKVAEVFRTLEAFYPGRVDLGIGRGRGASAATSLALRSAQALNSGDAKDDFQGQLSTLRKLLGLCPMGEHAASSSGLQASPVTAGAPQLWLLGSSVESAALAAQLGLPYSFSHLFSPERTRTALEHYDRKFIPGQLAQPKTSLALGVICADSHAEAEWLFQTVRLRWHRAAVNDHRPFASPESAAAELSRLAPLARPATEFPRYIYGSPEQVKTQLGTIAQQLNIQELLVSTITHDHTAREYSYTLLAEAFALSPRT